MFDDVNNMYYPEQARLGNNLSSPWFSGSKVEQRVVSGVETPASLKFENVSPQMSRIALLEVGCNGQGQEFSAQLRNIPIAKVYLGYNYSWKTDGRGVVVAVVEQRSPAELAGMRVGDLITSVDERPVRSHADLNFVLSRYSPGETVKMTVLRGGDRVSLAIKAGEGQ
jgi:predicted metalloprotease with PDZ domain